MFYVLRFLQFASVKAGDVFSYVVPVWYRMTPLNTSLEEKALFIQAADEVIVYASNKRVSFNYISLQDNFFTPSR